jgi:hypothetical protein
MAAYARASAMHPDLQPQVGADRTPLGTVNALAVDYYRSMAWSDLSTDTRKKRRRIIERFREQHGSKRAVLLRNNHIEKMAPARVLIF